MEGWTTVSITDKTKKRMEKYLEGKESWNKGINRILDELDYSRDLRKKYRLK